MAASDYYLCDVCDAKAFYDADLAYDNDNHNPETLHPWPDYVGGMVAICSRCADEYKCAVVKK